MKIRVEMTDGLEEDEVVIRCSRMHAALQRIYRTILEQSQPAPEIVFFKENSEFYFPLERVLFFETGGEHIYAHTREDAYRIRYRLYELEEILPGYFLRASKSVIVNSRQVYSLEHNLASSSLVQFRDSHKQIYVSRRYYQILRRHLHERSRYEK